MLADPEAIPLVATPMARERAYATATVIATEQAIAAAVEIEVARTDAPSVDRVAALSAVADQERELGKHLTVGQRAAGLAVTTSGRGTELIVGVAGAGKTTAVAAVRQAFEAEGFEVIGTSTSGQAARTLKRQAGIEASRTLASLTWRLEQGQLALSDRHVVVLDEAAMTADAGLLQVLSAASRAGAKVVLVGDHRQLGAVGPGGGFESLVARSGAAVHVLDETCASATLPNARHWRCFVMATLPKLLPVTRVAAASSLHPTAPAPSKPWSPGGPPMWPRDTRP